MSTKDNLKEAFAGESQANRMYLAFAARAEKDGLHQVAKLFRAAAEAETVHALAHFRVMEGINDTIENLKAAIEGEGYEFQTMYPDFVEQAKQDGEKKAQKSFEFAMAVEKIHHDLYSKALEAVENGQDMPETPVYVCPVCGNTVEGDVPDSCPICNVPGSKFKEI
ncbi:MAG: rubrerythrin family protein [candidate division KSB1 bacterium]|nr:rubrerythrin family protein [candidate division KSB1 bacterium]